MFKKITRTMTGMLLTMAMLLSVAGVCAAEPSDYQKLGLTKGYVQTVNKNNFETFTQDKLTYDVQTEGLHTYSNLAYGWGKTTSTDTHQWMNYYGANSVPANYTPLITTEEDTTNKVLKTQYSDAEGVTNGTVFQVTGVNPTSSMQAWEVRVKLPSTTGETRLFYYTNVKSADWGGYRGGVHCLAQATSPISLRDGKVYTANFTINEEATYTHTNPGFVLDNEIAGMTMEAGKWYRIVRMMDLSDSMNHKQKILLFDENDNLIKTSDWVSAGSYRHQSTMTFTSANSNSYLSSVSICGQNYDGSVLFDDLDIHDLSTPTATITTEKDPNVKVNRVVEMNPLTNKVSTFGTVGTDYASFDYGRYAIDLYMTNTSGKIGLFGMSVPKPAWLTNYDNGYSYLTQGSSLVYIKDGAVHYSTIDDVSLANKFDNIDTHCAAVTNTNGAVTLKSGKWYRFVLEADLRNNVAMLTDSSKANQYKLTIVDKETDEAVVNGFTIDSKLLRAGTELAKAQDAIQSFQNDNGTAKPCGWTYFAYVDIAAKGLTAPIYFDNISCLGTDDAALTGDAQVSIDFEADECTLGTTLATKFPSKVAGYDYQVTLGAEDNMQNIVSYDPFANPDFITTGRISTNQPANVLITFSEAMDASSVNENTITFTTKDGAAVDGYSVSYDADTKTATLSLGTLEYETDYILKLTNNVVNTMGIGVTGKTINLTVANEPFLVSNAHFVNAAGVGYNTAAALSKNDQVYGKATLTNNGTATAEYLVLLVLYKDGRMVDVSTATGTLTAGESKPVQTEDMLTVVEDGTTAVVMVWDNWSNMKPRSAASVLPR